MPSYYISLGATAGSAATSVLRAIECLAAEQDLVECSSLYLARPASVEDESPSVHAVVRIESEDSPLALLMRLKRLEAQMRRTQGPRPGPRAIELTILWARDMVYDGLLLCLPHPRLTERGFILVPLLELAPDLVHPVLAIPLQQFRDALVRQGEEPVVFRRRRSGAIRIGRR